MLVNFFFIVWLLILIDDTKKYIAMVSAATYYFDSNAEKDGNASVMTGFRFAYMKNMGSLCFGSFIMAVVTIIKMIVDALAESASANPTNPAAKCIACCAQCCIRFIEACIEYLTKHAYAYMAVTGDSFCKSAWNGFLLNMKHCAKFYFAQTIAAAFIAFGIFAVFCANMGIAYLMFTKITSESTNVGEHSMGPWGIFVIVSMVTPLICLGLFDEAVVTTL